MNRRPRHRKRMVLIVLLFIGAGAIVNVAVAWGCALWSRSDAISNASTTPEASKRLWQTWHPSRLPPTQWHTWYRSDFGVTKHTVFGQDGTVHDLQYGWPLRTGKLIGRQVGSTKTELLYAWLVPNDVSWLNIRKNEVVPLAPIWPGFAINSLFYAALLGASFALPAVLRRKRRRSRGLCPACAYPIGSSELCTECGTPITSRS